MWRSCVTVARERYRKDYQAEITPDPDCFIAACEDTPDGIRPTACAGLTHGGGRTLLSEHYLGSPPEQALAALFGEQVDPHTVVEIGPMAAAGGGGVRLLTMLPALCWCQGAQFIVCTITELIARTVGRLGIEFVPMAEAKEHDLPVDLRHRWGTYYDTNPVTGYVDLRGYDAQLERQVDRTARLSVTGYAAPATGAA
ncbi:thermostable hemolysin [Amycolatopsis pithecellobii]|nr:thermostable hemolysin [Amycolatopsis pithecellobii]